MADQLSNQSEKYLAEVVAGGLYPSKEAALEAAVTALREKNEQLPEVPPEHAELVEQGLASARAGRSRSLDDAVWAELRQLAQDTAAGRTPGGQ